VARLGGLHRDFRVLPQPPDRYPLGGVAKPFTRRDDERAAESRGRTSEGLRIGELAPEVQRAEKAEDLAARHARSAAQLRREREARTVIEEKGGTLAMRRGGGTKEDRPCRVISLERHEREPTRPRVHPAKAIEPPATFRTL